MKQVQNTVTVDDAGKRVDVYVARVLGVSRSQAERLVRDGHVLVNGTAVKPGRILRAGDRVLAEEPPAEPWHLKPEPLALDVLYRDEHLLVVNKPRGLVVHPAAGHADGTLANALLALLPELPAIGGLERPGIVHRLDKDTSGLMLVALSEQAYHTLQAMIKDRLVDRRYVALVWGNPAFETATVEAAIGRHPHDRKRMAVLPEDAPGARPAITELTVLRRYGLWSYIEARLRTGRTHQIRVHCAYARHPVVGDPLYGSPPGNLASEAHRTAAPVMELVSRLNGQMLHAHRLALQHPVTGTNMSFEADPPEEMRLVLDALERWRPAG